jgi:DNA (cytosine-5)-methyltransferase 1
MGLHRAGFDVVGVDNRPQPRYPFRFVQADALRPPFDMRTFDFIWASPPCQTHTLANNQDRRGKHKDLIPATRELLANSGAITVIENVRHAPLRVDLVLDGTMFPGLRTVRRRHFEMNFRPPLAIGFPSQGLVSRHRWVSATDGDTSSHTRAARRKAGQPIRDPVPYVAACLGVDWMRSRYEVAQAIPPAYSEFIGRAALAHGFAA